MADVDPLIDEKKGNVSAVARALGVSRTTIWKRICESTTLQKKLSDARETMLDNAESVLYRKVLDGSTTELIFFLKTQGRYRGYVQRMEHTGAEGEPIEIKGYLNVSPDDWSDKTDL